MFDWLEGKEAGQSVIVFFFNFTRYEERVRKGQDGWMGGEEKEGLGCAVSLTLQCNG